MWLLLKFFLVINVWNVAAQRPPHIRTNSGVGAQPPNGAHPPANGGPPPNGAHPPANGGPPPNGAHPPANGAHPNGAHPPANGAHPNGAHPPANGGPPPNGAHPPANGGHHNRAFLDDDEPPGAGAVVSYDSRHASSEEKLFPNANSLVFSYGSHSSDLSEEDRAERAERPETDEQRKIRVKETHNYMHRLGGDKPGEGFNWGNMGFDVQGGAIGGAGVAQHPARAVDNGVAQGNAIRGVAQQPARAVDNGVAQGNAIRGVAQQPARMANSMSEDENRDRRQRAPPSDPPVRQEVVPPGRHRRENEYVQIPPVRQEVVPPGRHRREDEYVQIRQTTPTPEQHRRQVGIHVQGRWGDQFGEGIPTAAYNSLLENYDADTRLIDAENHQGSVSDESGLG